MASAPEARKTVTVVFIDVADSTSLGEKLDPESVRGLMSRYFELASTVLGRHGGAVEKFIGDAVMAVFGIPRVHEDDALRAVRAADELRERLAALNEELEEQWGARLAIRTGIDTGEVVVGDPARQEAFATGDTVNVAARLEQSAGHDEVLLGPETYRLVRDAVRAEPLEPLALKGKTEPVPAWRLVDVRADELSPEVETPFVGREAELAELLGSFARTGEERSCRLVTVFGQPGIGKSRLASEFLASADGRARVHVGRCPAYGEGITYRPLAEIVKQIGGDDPRPALTSLVAGDESAALIVERIEEAVGLAESNVRAEEIFWAVRRLLEATAERKPLIVVLDDLHWAEPTFLDLVEYLAGFSKAPILLLCLARSELLEARPSWGTPRPNATSVFLDALSDRESEQLVLASSAHDVPEALRARIVEAAEGNPLFVEQMLALEAENGSAGGASAIPPTIHALLTARIDRLEPAERTVIERACIEGRLFHRGAVSTLLPEGEREGLSTQLVTLVRKGLVQPDRSDFPGDDAFRFAHGLIREAAYDAIPKESRADLHERFADWLERASGERSGEYEEILGHHLARAYRYRLELGPIHDEERELARRAAVLLGGGGRRALRRGDLPASARLLDDALTLLPGNDEARLELLFDLGSALYRLGELDRTDVVLAEAIQLARELGDRRLEWHAIVLRTHAHLTTDPESRNREQLFREAHEAIAVFEQEGDDVGLARAFFLLVDVCWMEGQGAEAERAAQRAFDHAERAGSHIDVAEGLELISWVMLDGPTTVSESLRRCEALIAGAGGDHWVRGSLLAWLGTQQGMLGRFDEARGHVAEATAITRDLGLPWYEGVALLLSGYVEMLAASPAAAEESMRAAQRRFREVGDGWWLSTVTVELPTAVYEQGRYEEAFALTEAFDEAPAPYDREWQIKRRAIRAKVLARRGELLEAETLALEAVGLAEQTDFLNFHAESLLDLAEVLHLAGRDAEAVDCVHRAGALFEQKGNVASAKKAAARLRELQPSPAP